MSDWEKISLGPGRAMFQDSQGGLHSVPLEHLDDAREIDDGLVVLATSPEEWRAFVQRQRFIEAQWALRNTFTGEDGRMLSAMGVAW